MILLRRPAASNSIFAIQLYKLGTTLVFDDQARDLLAEPFVGDSNTALKILALGKGVSEDGFILIFSAQPFPGSEFTAEWIGKGDAEIGDWFEVKHELIGRMDCWLCPALLKYFSTTPKEIHFQIRDKE